MYHKRLFLLVVSVQALESKHEAKTAANLTICSFLSISFIFLIVFLCSNKRYQIISSLTKLFLFLQFSRGAVLISFRRSTFFKEYWKQTSALFNPITIWDISDDPIDDKYHDLGITSYNFIANSEGWLILISIGLIAYTVVSLLTMDYKNNLNIFYWIYLVSFNDVMLYMILQLQNIEISGSSALCILVGVVYALGFTILVYSSFKEPRNYFTFEFQSKPYLYYPFIMITRLLSAIFLIVCENGLLQFSFLIAFQGFLIGYLIIRSPYIQSKYTLIDIFYHVSELSCMSLPFLYENMAEEEVLNGLLIVCVICVFLMCLVRILFIFMKFETRANKGMKIDTEKQVKTFEVNIRRINEINTAKCSLGRFKNCLTPFELQEYSKALNLRELDIIPENTSKKHLNSGIA